MSKKPYVFQVSTKPDITSYKWIGKELSILSTILLWWLWLCRFLSLYQHIKAIIRIFGTAIGRNNTDNKSGRPNIPPMAGEIYFIFWTTFFSLVHVFQWDSMVFRLLMIYYLFESSVWILYYTVFRRFFELGYSIYHKLEYLTAIILIIPTQALCFANLYNTSFRNILTGLLGSASDSTPFPVVVLGCLFSAIVISMIISTFPMEAIKKTQIRPNMFIVGCGDVVTKRLYPAIKNGAYANKIKAYDKAPAKEENPYCECLESSEAICKEIDRKATENDIVWIETPSNTHVSYLKQLIETDAKLIVVEKPISVKKEELQEVEMLVRNPKIRNRLFFLSYYMLEKALPLHYLVHFNEKYERYLDIDDQSLIKNWRLLLGSLESVKVHICEGEDNRRWVYEDANGGHLLETFIHNVLIASLICGTPYNWANVEYSNKQSPEKACEMLLSANCGQAKIELYQKKNAPVEECVRYAEFRFTNGVIEMDLGNKLAKIYFKSLDKYSTVSVKKDFEDRYSVLVDMVSTVAEGSCASSEIDGFTNQISIIRWLLALKKDGKSPNKS